MVTTDTWSKAWCKVNDLDSLCGPECICSYVVNYPIDIPTFFFLRIQAGFCSAFGVILPQDVMSLFFTCAEVTAWLLVP